jgi:signal transduction histidine kinase
MFRSLRSRLWLTYALVVGAALGIVAVAVLLFLARNNLEANLQLRNTLGNLLSRPALLQSLRQDNLAEVAARIDEAQGVRVILLSPDGGPLVDSREDSEAPIPELRRVPLSDTVRQPVLNIRDSNGAVWLYTGRQVAGGNYLVVAVPRQPLRNMLDSPLLGDLLTSILQAGGAALILALLFAYLISRWVAAPLQDMSAAVQAVAEGGQTQVRLEGPKEVRELGQAFNQMTRRVHASQQSQRDFVANVSHELKTPLTSIQGFAQAMLDGTARSPEELEKSAQIIYDESGRMHRLVIDLLDLARLDAGTADLERVSLDLAAMLRAIGEKFAPQSQSTQVALTTEIEPLPTFIGDGDRLAQVFTNMVDNALKHTPAGGQVALRARQVGDQVEISVSDSGPGIPQEELNRIFERFYQLDKSRSGGDGRGAGLGLAIAREIVNAHGGHINAASEARRGSTFTVTLPAARSDDSTVTMQRKP